MDNFFSDNSTINISDGVIDNIDSDRGTTFITVSYSDCVNCTSTDRSVKLIVDRNTRIFNENGNRIPVSDLRVGMAINATMSSAMTRSIPPQSSALVIRIIGRPLPDNVAIGRIVDVDRQNRNFTTISDTNLSSIIRFNVPMDTRILNRNGRPINFNALVPGLSVRVRHAAFMTASIPPQTTAFEVRIR